MVTTEDLSPGDRLPEPMIVEVTNVDRDVGRARRAEVNLLDESGNTLRLVDYEGADLSVDWQLNHRYRVSRCSLAKGGSEHLLTLTPSKRTRVEPLGPVKEHSSILIIGDTHIGRDRHPKTGEEIDPLEAFTKAIEFGLDRNVDAVVHVGDIFHETVTPVRAVLLDQRVFAPLEEAGIPFYYVEGNHRSPAGDDILEARSDVSVLDTQGVAVGDTRIFGISHHNAGEIPWNSLRFPRDVTEPTSILVLHQTIQQLSGVGPKSLDLDRLLRQFNHPFDLILSGHHHDATQKRWNGIPIMYTGASERMSTNKNPTDRVAWFLTVNTSSLAPEQFDIP